MRVYDSRTMTPQEREIVMTRSVADVFNPENLEGVRAIIEDVRRNGDQALVDALARFDGVSISPEEIRIDRDEIERAHRDVSPEVQQAIATSSAAIRRYNERLLQGSSWLEELAPGELLGEQSTPIERVGLYVPCGKGSFPSVMVQIGTPAVVAGVAEIAVVLPPLGGEGKRVDPAVLVAADELGIDEIYRSNGPSGIAALALGTETIRSVWKIAGPGSPAVTAAQILVQTEGVAVAMLFGPSESLIIADDSADPHILAADFLNEAEHGYDSASILVTPSRELVDTVQQEVDRQIALLPEPRRSYAQSATSKYGGAVIVQDLEEAITFANDYAPEHMQVATRDPIFVLGRLTNAGEILLGQDTPMSAANFAIGVPATLPTGGFAKVTSAVTAHTFRKRSSVAYLDRDALTRMAGTVLALAEHEGFPQHARTLRVRGLDSSDAG